MKPLPNTAIYLRVSSWKQDTASQEPDLRRWLAAQGSAARARWYCDTFTGRTMDRPGFKALWDDVCLANIQTVVVWRLDRLGRTASGLTKLFDDLRARKVNLISLKDGIDLATAAGRLMANVLASVAAYDNEVRAERVVAGQAAARARGVHLGRPAGSSVPLKTTAHLRARSLELRDAGHPALEIANLLGLSLSTVRRIFRSTRET